MQIRTFRRTGFESEIRKMLVQTFFERHSLCVLCLRRAVRYPLLLVRCHNEREQLFSAHKIVLFIRTRASILHFYTLMLEWNARKNEIVPLYELWEED